jgi:CheY-like chemotaxis protein/anti-sigma regulatory factor (Ser/Thr protein kinase)
MVDPHQVEQVLLNLLRNAQDAIRERRPAAGVILVSTEHRDGHIRIAVRDNGCGIPDDIRDKIMQPFFTTKAPGEGSGLGLAMSYGILTEHGGDIEVESLPGDTTVTLRFPVVAASGDEAEAGAVRAAGPAPAGEIRPGTRLLLVDDEEFVLEAVRDILDGRVRVDTASSGLEAIQKLSRGEFDVVLSDMRMPGLGGREVYRWLAEHRPGMERRIIFATGDTCDPGTFEFLQQSGATCLTKPFRLDGLLDAIATVTAT